MSFNRYRVPSAAMAKGRIQGAIVGGLAGHYRGRRGVLGAIGGPSTAVVWLTRSAPCERKRARPTLRSQLALTSLCVFTGANDREAQSRP